MRQKFGEFAERLETIRYRELLVEDIQFIKNWGDKIFGPYFWSIRRVVSVFLAVLTIIALSLLLRATYYPITEERTVFALGEEPREVLLHTIYVSDLLLSHAKFILFHFAIFFVTVSITLLMIKFAARAASLAKALLFLCLDVVMIAVQVLPFLYVWVIALLGTQLFNSSKESVVLSIILNDALIFIFLPSIAYFLIFIVRMLTKATRKFLVPFVTLILVRFEESEKGVLTNLSIGLGVLVKLVQQALKVFV